MAAVLTLFRALPDSDTGGFVLVVCLALLAAGAGWALSAWNPAVVSIRDGVLEVTRSGHSDEFDLRDPETSVDLGSDPKSPSWKAKVANPDGKRVTIGARDVKARHFSEIVDYHRSRLRDPDESSGTAAPS